MKLQEMRKKAGLSQTQLANKAEINVRTLQYYEQGVKIFDNARIDTILKVWLALDCRVKDVFENKNISN